jgi:hypothetical protein
MKETWFLVGLEWKTCNRLLILSTGSSRSSVGNAGRNGVRIVKEVLIFRGRTPRVLRDGLRYIAICKPFASQHKPYA